MPAPLLSGSRPVAAPDPGALLLRRVARGDSRALKALHDRFADFAGEVALPIVEEPSDADEVVVDVFVQLWESASSYDPERGSVRTWIGMIARARAFDLVRARRRRSRALERLTSRAGSWVARAAAAAPPDRQAERARTRELVQGLLAELPAPQRRAIELAYFRGLSHREIARELDEPLGTVKTRIRIGLRKLGRALRPIREQIR